MAIAFAVSVPAQTALAQENGGRVVPTSQVVISGYGGVGYAVQTEGDNANAFNALVSPTLLFQFQDLLLFETQLEFDLEEGVSQTGLTYAQLDVLVHDNLVLSGGKLLLPFGVFGDRLRPTWINRFPSAPPIYRHHIAAFGAEPLMPVLSDVGVMVRGVVTPGKWNAALNLYVTQGPDSTDGTLTPGVPFSASSSDNNTSKMIGGRLDIAAPPWLEVNISGLSAAYDSDNVLDFSALNLTAECRFAGFEARGEYIRTWQQVTGFDEIQSVVRDGFYAQLTYRHGRVEPVVRWTQAMDSERDGAVLTEGAWQAGFGLNYRFVSSVVVAAAYELNREDGMELDNDRLLTSIAFGF
jgi:hypothetical protein